MSTHPTPKQLVVRSLRSLHKQRMDLMFRAQALAARRAVIRSEERDVKARLRAVDAKLQWDLNKHSGVLNDE